MKSAEIRESLNQLEVEKAKLEKELRETIKAEEEERKLSLFNDSKTFIKRLWELYWKDDDNSESQRRLDEIKEQYMLNTWINAEVEAVLKKTKLDALKNIKQLISKYGIECNLEACIIDAKTRLDFAGALRNVRHGSDISHNLGYRFAPDDLMELMKLHKSNKFRNKIEDLLEDCNYHSECSLLIDKKYDEFERFVMKNC